MGQTPLHCAIESPIPLESSYQRRYGTGVVDAPSIVRLLLDNDNVDVNILDRCGRSPLMYAIQLDKHDIVSILLADRRLNVNSGDDQYSLTPLMGAAIHGNAAMLELLLKHPDVDLDLKTRYGHTALSVAIRFNNNEAIRLIREKYAIMGKDCPETALVLRQREPDEGDQRADGGS